LLQRSLRGGDRSGADKAGSARKSTKSASKAKTAPSSGKSAHRKAA
jgi:hypothetical protein